VEYKVDRVVDCVGMYCPIPLFNTMEALEDMKPGEVLRLVTGDRGALTDIPRWVKSSGHRLLKVYEEDGCFNFLIMKMEVK